ncbi:hypothetical protein Axi01nite_32170 [Actinoplanes xinjiangensis]|nr:hypothetical protein Axi01nite_32170 [Actinoplanes xinjiangensis]
MPAVSPHFAGAGGSVRRELFKVPVRDPIGNDDMPARLEGCPVSDIPRLTSAAPTISDHAFMAAHASVPGTPAGWYADPGGAFAQRWWDGRQWTDIVRQPVQPAAPAATPADHPSSARGRHAPASSPRSRVVLIGVAGAVLAAAGVAAALYAGDSPAPAGVQPGVPAEGVLTALTGDPQAADKSAQSDVRGAISEVEQYYTEYGGYPATGFAGGNRDGGTPEVAIGTSSETITVSAGTRLYYYPGPAAYTYRICATNTGGTGKWYLYDSARGGSVGAVTAPVSPETCG